MRTNCRIAVKQAFDSSLKLLVLHAVHDWIDTTVSRNKERAEDIQCTGEIQLKPSTIEHEESYLTWTPADKEYSKDDDQGFEGVSPGTEEGLLLVVHNHGGLRLGPGYMYNDGGWHRGDS